MRNLIKKEILALIYSPGFYLIYILFVFAWFYTFFRNVFLVGFSTLSSLFEIYPWILLFVVGALSMGTIAKERELGTLELLLSRPLSTLHIVLSKIFSLSLLLFSSLLFVIPTVIAFNRVGSLDFGIIVLQFISAVLLIVFLVSLGVAVSSFFNSQLTSLICFVFTGLALFIVGLPYVTLRLPIEVAKLFDRFSVLAHYNSLSRGVFDMSDALYFVVLIILFILVASFQLQKITKSYAIGFTMLQALLISITVFLIYGFTGLSLYRSDFTTNKSFTLSKVTISSLEQLNAPLKLTLYASSNIPTQYAPILKEVKYILYDIVKNSKNNVTLQILDPNKSTDIAAEANRQGVNLTQFNVIGKEKLEVVTGYLGLTLEYKTNKEVIPFITGIDGFEYTITSLIRKNIGDSKKIIKFVFGDGEHDIDSDLFQLRSSLYGNYTIKSQSNIELDETADVLVVAGPTSDLNDNTLAIIKSFLEKGKSLVILVDRFSVNSALTALSNENNLVSLLESYGIYVKRNLVFDTSANETLGLSDGTKSFKVQYPFWLRSVYDPESDMFTASSVKYVSLPWVSSITYDPLKLKEFNLLAKPLLVTTNNASIESVDESTTSANISPDRVFDKPVHNKTTVGITLEKSGTIEGSGRSVIIGDAELLTDMYLERVPSNIGFGMDLFAWVTKDNSMSELQTKLSPLSPFHFSSEGQPEEIKRSIYGYVIAIPSLLGLTLILLRKLRTSR